MKKLITLLCIALILMAINISCSEKDDSDTMPELPPVEALMIDFNDFIDNPAQAGGTKSLNTIENASHAYLTASIWNVLVSANMIVPVASYLEALKHTPQYLGENKWQWSYSITVGTDVYTARLQTKRISNEEFLVYMLVSMQGVFEDFKWFEGTVRYDRTHAIWAMFDPLTKEEWLTIEWNMDWEKEVSDITYTYTKEGEVKGSYLTYGIVEDEIYDAFYTVSWAQKLVKIEWNLTSKAGRVKDAVKFVDNEWHCWNESFQDVDCSN